MRLNVIFLDIDGVLNHQVYFKEEQAAGHVRSSSFEAIDRQCIKHLNTLIKDTNSVVVVTSVWRYGHTVDSLQARLVQYGFTGTIIDFTEDFCRKYTWACRGNEIQAWIDTYLQSRPYDTINYVILDDDSDMLLHHSSHFVLTDNYIGITPTTVYKATKILSKVGD